MPEDDAGERRVGSQKLAAWFWIGVLGLIVIVGAATSLPLSPAKRVDGRILSVAEWHRGDTAEFELTSSTDRGRVRLMMGHGCDEGDRIMLLRREGVWRTFYRAEPAYCFDGAPEQPLP